MVAHPSSWLESFTPREQRAIDHARAYAALFEGAGTPGHNQFLLIAKLAEALDAQAGLRVHFAIERTLEEVTS